MSDKLWCINVTGPDDVIPAATRTEAVEFAARFNDWWLERFGEKGLDENEPIMWAVPILWPHDDASHADGLLKPSDEYVWLKGAKTRLQLFAEATP